jgi:hypothetical protein
MAAAAQNDLIVPVAGFDNLVRIAAILELGPVPLEEDQAWLPSQIVRAHPFRSPDRESRNEREAQLGKGMAVARCHLSHPEGSGPAAPPRYATITFRRRPDEVIGFEPCGFRHYVVQEFGLLSVLPPFVGILWIVDQPAWVTQRRCFRDYGGVGRSERESGGTFS